MIRFIDVHMRHNDDQVHWRTYASPGHIIVALFAQELNITFITQHSVESPLKGWIFDEIKKYHYACAL